MSTALERPVFEVRGQVIADGAPLFVIAEIGLNHGGSAARARQMVEAAAVAGASAVKLQSLHAATLVAPSCPAPAHVQVASLVDFFARFELDEATHYDLATHAHELGLAFISTPFDERAVDMLVRVGADALKIASGDVTHTRLIACAARTGLPLIISTGMSDLREVDAAVSCARAHGAVSVALLHCVSAYPVPSGSENLAAIRTLAARWQVPVGLSDHSRDRLAVPLAVALGASIYERHLVLDDRDAVDSDVSSTAGELRDLIAAAEHTRHVLGHGRRECLAAEEPNRIPSRRGIYAARTLRPGDHITPADLSYLRPEEGIPASHWKVVVGARVIHPVEAGAPLPFSALEGPGRTV